MTVSAKRAHSRALPICVDTIDLNELEAQPKRLKQQDDAAQALAEKRSRTGRPRGSGPLKASKIQAFFTVRPSQSGNNVEPPPVDSCPEQIEEAAESETTNAESEAPPVQRRPLFRDKGIPAPLPTEHTHVPFPVYHAFEAVGDTCRGGRYSAEAINGAAQRAAERALMLRPAREQHLSLVDGESADGGCAQWQREMSSWGSAPLWQRQSADCTRIRTTPARVLLSRHLPPAPPHLQSTEPLLRQLCHQDALATHQPSQLLSLRYRPRRARDVLDNQRVVSQLLSWIESMRLKRPAPQPSIAPPKPAARFCQHRSASDDSGDSSDDFVPQTRRPARRRTNRADGLGDVTAWAQSNGTLNSVRERARLPARHRRYGSSG
ncbi:hypothetical protein GGI21_005717, partial [Coemansia aciculifera]